MPVVIVNSTTYGLTPASTLLGLLVVASKLHVFVMGWGIDTLQERTNDPTKYQQPLEPESSLALNVKECTRGQFHAIGPLETARARYCLANHITKLT